MEQRQNIKFISDDKKIILLCDSDTTLGLLHDFLMVMKAHVMKAMNEAFEKEKVVVEPDQKLDVEKVEQ